MVGSFRAQHFQKSRKFHELPRKWFHLKPLNPTHPGGAVSGDTGREGGSRKVGVKELEGRKLEGGRRTGGESEEGGRRDGEGRQEGGLR